MLAEMKVPPHVVEKLLNHTMGSIGNKADSIVSAVAEVYNLAKYLPEMRDAIEKSWEPYLERRKVLENQGFSHGRLLQLWAQERICAATAALDGLRQGQE